MLVFLSLYSNTEKMRLIIYLVAGVITTLASADDDHQSFSESVPSSVICISPKNISALVNELDLIFAKNATVKINNCDVAQLLGKLLTKTSILVDFMEAYNNKTDNINKLIKNTLEKNLVVTTTTTTTKPATTKFSNIRRYTYRNKY